MPRGPGADAPGELAGRRAGVAAGAIIGRVPNGSSPAARLAGSVAPWRQLVQSADPRPVDTARRLRHIQDPAVYTILKRTGPPHD